MRAFSLVLIGCLAACSAPREADTASEEIPPSAATPRQAPTEPTQPPEPVATPPAWLEQHAIPSNGGAYILRVSPSPAELPDNEPFQLEVWVTDAHRPNEIARDVELGVAAAMPEHGHGMNRVPKATKREDGSFLVDGMLFHMTGHWELYLDVTRGAVTERTQCDIVLE